ncbi:MAG: glycoside hydrolase family 3 C-terminal domain-containing protein [candidate division KSB1 bacterium]|nr:glycoside hydrolase family 3 C-terminal domain-containing protein [candidate division KSB1 bacterium]
MKKYLFIILTLLAACANTNRKAADAEWTFEDRYETVIDSVLAELTLEEKVHLLHGTGKFVSGGVERLGIPELHYTDGPNGIREELERHSWNSLNLTTDSVTFFPTGPALAATWNRELAEQYGRGIGLEARARGKDVLLGPAVNIMRTPICGRNFEYFTEDPFLNAEIAVGYVRGVQRQDVAACVKHYALNNQEEQRGSISVQINERALREIYMPVYRAVVQQADAHAMMGAYNRFRGEYLCQNDYLNNTVLKDEFGFKGIVVSDWGATHNTEKAAWGGLDVEMGTGQPYDENYMAKPLLELVKAGLVPDSLVNDKARRVLRVIYNLKKSDSTRTKGEKTSPLTRRIAYDVASEAVVLLKNQNILPLNPDTINSIAVIGTNAHKPQSRGGHTASVKAKYEISPWQGLKSKLGTEVALTFSRGYEETFMQSANSRHRIPSQTANDSLIDAAVQFARSSDVAIIFAGASRDIETEGRDRRDLTLPFGQDKLIRSVCAANPNTIVVFLAGAAYDIQSAVNLAPAVLYGWFNGSEAGRAMADILFGDVNPSGKLPFTLPKRLEDVGAHALNAYPGENGTVVYKEGLLVGYRWFDSKQIDPIYPFGHGLSYTSFEYSGPETDKSVYHSGDVIEITCAVKNTGSIEGKETVQCYVSVEESRVLRPDKALKAFDKVFIKAGETKTAKLHLPVSELAYYNDANAEWQVEPGQYTLMIGTSSRDIRGKVNVEIINSP